MCRCVDVLLSTSERPLCAVGLLRMPNFWCPTILRLRENSIDMLRCRHTFLSHNIHKESVSPYTSTEQNSHVLLIDDIVQQEYRL